MAEPESGEKRGEGEHFFGSWWRYQSTQSGKKCYYWNKDTKVEQWTRPSPSPCPTTATYSALSGQQVLRCSGSTSDDASAGTVARSSSLATEEGANDSRRATPARQHLGSVGRTSPCNASAATTAVPTPRMASTEDERNVSAGNWTEVRTSVSGAGHRRSPLGKDVFWSPEPSQQDSAAGVSADAGTGAGVAATAADLVSKTSALTKRASGRLAGRHVAIMRTSKGKRPRQRRSTVPTANVQLLLQPRGAKCGRDVASWNNSVSALLTVGSVNTSVEPDSTSAELASRPAETDATVELDDASKADGVKTEQNVYLKRSGVVPAHLPRPRVSLPTTAQSVAPSSPVEVQQRAQPDDQPAATPQQQINETPDHIQQERVAHVRPQQQQLQQIRDHIQQEQSQQAQKDQQQQQRLRKIQQGLVKPQQQQQQQQQPQHMLRSGVQRRAGAQTQQSVKHAPEKSSKVSIPRTVRSSSPTPSTSRPNRKSVGRVQTAAAPSPPNSSSSRVVLASQQRVDAAARAGATSGSDREHYTIPKLACHSPASAGRRSRADSPLGAGREDEIGGQVPSSRLHTRLSACLQQSISGYEVDGSYDGCTERMDTVAQVVPSALEFDGGQDECMEVVECPAIVRESPVVQVVKSPVVQVVQVVKLVVDTNVLMHSLRLVQDILNGQGVPAQVKCRLIVPIAVVRELDGLKQRHENAQIAAKFIRRESISGQNGRVQIQNHKEMIPDIPHEFSKTEDDNIVWCARYFITQSGPGEAVCLWTNDVNMLNMATAFNVPQASNDKGIRSLIKSACSGRSQVVVVEQFQRDTPAASSPTTVIISPAACCPLVTSTTYAVLENIFSLIGLSYMKSGWGDDLWEAIVKIKPVSSSGYPCWSFPSILEIIVELHWCIFNEWAEAQRTAARNLRDLVKVIKDDVPTDTQRKDVLQYCKTILSLFRPQDSCYEVAKLGLEHLNVVPKYGIDAGDAVSTLLGNVLSTVHSTSYDKMQVLYGKVVGNVDEVKQQLDAIVNVIKAALDGLSSLPFDDDVKLIQLPAMRFQPLCVALTPVLDEVCSKTSLTLTSEDFSHMLSAFVHKREHRYRLIEFKDGLQRVFGELEAAAQQYRQMASTQ